MHKRSKDPKRFLSPEENRQVELAIQDAEQQTTAEIKLILLRHCWGDIKQKSVELFGKHKLYATRHRNGVLILLVTTNREFVIHGDKGIHQAVGQKLWDEIRNQMAMYFCEGRFGAGLCEAIRMIGNAMRAGFPVSQDNPDELSNEIIHEQ